MADDGVEETWDRVQAPLELLRFWYVFEGDFDVNIASKGQMHWFKSTTDFDQQCVSGFKALWSKVCEEAQSGADADPSSQTAAFKALGAPGYLSLIILLDQLPRNMFRATPGMYASDSIARAVLREALAKQLDEELAVQVTDPEAEGPEQWALAFLYMPLMHSEDLADHVDALRLYESQPGLAKNYAAEEEHKAVIDRFGRFPSRNKILGRESTQEEEEFLKTHAGW